MNACSNMNAYLELYGSGSRPESSPLLDRIYVILTDGTGGNVDGCRSWWDSTASVTQIMQQTIPEVTPIVQSLAERVSAIKAAFGLTISQLAKVLRVERQTIYDWMDEENPPQAQEHKRERLAVIQRLAIQWNQLCPWPAGKEIATYAVDGMTLLDLLSADMLDETRTQAVMRGLSEQVKAEWQRKEERSLASRLRARGFQPVPDQSSSSVLVGISRTVSLYDDNS